MNCYQTLLTQTATFLALLIRTATFLAFLIRTATFLALLIQNATYHYSYEMLLIHMKCNLASLIMNCYLVLPFSDYVAASVGRCCVRPT